MDDDDEKGPDALNSLKWWTDSEGKLFEGWANYSQHMSPCCGYYQCTGDYFLEIWKKYGFTGPNQTYEIRKEQNDGVWTEEIVRQGDWGDPVT